MAATATAPRLQRIHPDYYQIPVADRQALIEATNAPSRGRRESENRSAGGGSATAVRRRRSSGERVQSEVRRTCRDRSGPCAQPVEGHNTIGNMPRNIAKTTARVHDHAGRGP